MDESDLLTKLAESYGLDKCISTSCHDYIGSYTKLFKRVRHDVKNLLEIGIGSLENGQMGGLNGPVATKFNYKTGNSLKCWEEYFPNSLIYGIDIFPHPELDINRVKTFVADQSNEQQLKTVIDEINAPLDIIIDDGSHQGEHQVFSFMYLHKYLSPKGIYVIEDIQPENIDGFKNLSVFPPDFKEYIKKNFYYVSFDTRKTSRRADDFLLAFIKKE